MISNSEMLPDSGSTYDAAEFEIDVDGIEKFRENQGLMLLLSLPGRLMGT